jgi:hypothetical protein
MYLLEQRTSCLGIPPNYADNSRKPGFILPPIPPRRIPCAPWPTVRIRGVTRVWIFLNAAGGEIRPGKTVFFALRSSVRTVNSSMSKFCLVVKMLPFEPIDRAKKLWMFGLC